MKDVGTSNDKICFKDLTTLITNGNLCTQNAALSKSSYTGLIADAQKKKKSSCPTVVYFFFPAVSLKSKVYGFGPYPDPSITPVFVLGALQVVPSVFRLAFINRSTARSG